MDISNRPSGAPTGLQFEVATEGVGLVFDSETEITVELDKEQSPHAPQPEPAGEFSIPDTFKVDERYNTQSFIDDPMRSAPTYVPRFTEVSENYRMRGDSRQRFGRIPTPVEKKDIAPSIDPTSEEDEERAVEHIVIAPQKSESDELKDESITILKFDAVPDEPDRDPDEAAARELEAAVIEAAAPARAAEPTEAPGIGADDETAATEAAPTAPATIPDPVLDLVDYSAPLDNPDMISDEEAPLEEEGTGKRGEFTKSSQRDAIKDSFLDSLMSVKVRFIAALILSLGLLAMTVLRLAGIDVLAMVGLGSVSFAWAVVDLQFAVCISLFSLPELLRGIRKLFARTVTPELIIIPSVAALIGYTVLVSVSGESGYSTFGVLVAMQVIATILSAYHRLAADFTSFKLISVGDVKGVLDKRLTRSLPRENLALDGAVDEYRSKIARMFRTAFISDFFSRTSRTIENSFNTLLMSIVTAGLALATGIVAYFLGEGSLATGGSAFMLVLLIGFPVFSILTHKLSYHRACREAESEESTFVGESSIYACSDIDVIAYEDTEIFGNDDVSIRKVHLYGKTYNATKAMKQMYALFSVIGGPLDYVFSSAVDRKGSLATDIVIEDDGVRGTLDGTPVYAGTAEFMRRHGVTIPEDDYKTNSGSPDSTKVMYGAEGSLVYVKFFIRYSFSEEFSMLLPCLKERKIVPLVYTRDPNITNELLKMLTLGEDLIRVMKKKTSPTTDEKVYRRVSAGLVTLGDKASAINTVLLAKRYTAYQDGLSATELVAMTVGAALSAMLSLAGALGMYATVLGVLQLAWCVYLYIRTARRFSYKKKKKEINDATEQ